MADRIDLNLFKELKDYGTIDVEKCFNCGNCTAICPFTSGEYPFPRNMIRMVQIGDTERLKQSLEPWLCYYCGDCSATCPRQAEPGETMMSIRRWLTGQYDFTGLAKLFYTNKAWEVGSMIALGLFVGIMMLVFGGPMMTDQVALNTFAPAEIVHIADFIMAGFLVFFILCNVYRMHKFIMIDGMDEKIQLSVYIKEAWRLAVHAATQKRWAECDEGKEEKQTNMNWLSHLLLVTGYVSMLVSVVFFLNWLQTDEILPIYAPQRIIKIYASVVVLYGTARALWGRYKKSSQYHRFSHLSDWLFPVLLFSVTLTGACTHLFRSLDMPLAVYYTYVVHLSLVAPMLILEVPFGKWSHLYYRPLAMFFEKVKERAKEEAAVAAAAQASAD